jgi:transposase
MKKTERKNAEAQIRERYEKVKDTLSERARRLFVAAEANSYGHGGIAAASRATGMAPSAIYRGIREIEAIEAGKREHLPKDRSRSAGGGRKKVEDKHPELLDELRKLVEETTRGDPTSPLLWTARSLRNIQTSMKKLSFNMSPSTLSRLLKKLGYSLQSNRKKAEGAQHPDRNAQFEHIGETVRRQLDRGDPTISVDTKKKELVGNYKNAGKELRPSADPEQVEAYDFEGPQGKAIPYGVYDIGENEAWVSVGINHDTAEFAVATIRKWWYEMASSLYITPKSLLITADGGGSNGYRLRLWKVELQKLADELGFPISVCHLPPGTSKWNKIEHRLFSFITQNWRGKPLITHQVIVDLITATKTTKGLTVKSSLDTTQYKKGIRVSDQELANVRLIPDNFHGEWNYTILPSAYDNLQQ